MLSGTACGVAVFVEWGWLHGWWVLGGGPQGWAAGARTVPLGA